MWIVLACKELSNKDIAASERDTYGLYIKKTSGSEDAGNQGEMERMNEEASMGGNEKETADDEMSGEEENAEVSEEFEWGIEGEGQIATVSNDGGEVSEIRDVEEKGEKGALEERDEWPIWLKRAVEMLEAGERGIQLTATLEKFVWIERALGFKVEKTVSLGNMKQKLLTDRTMNIG